MADIVDELTPGDKDEIIRLAIRVCKWVGWLSGAEPRGGDAIKDLKDVIESRSGMEIEEYT